MAFINAYYQYILVVLIFYSTLDWNGTNLDLMNFKKAYSKT